MEGISNFSSAFKTHEILEETPELKYIGRSRIDGKRLYKVTNENVLKILESTLKDIVPITTDPGRFDPEGLWS